MLTFLFWNLARAPLQDSVARLALRHDVDILALAECAIDPAVIMPALNSDIDNNGVYRPVESNTCPRIQLYSRFANRFWAPVRESRYLTLQRLSLPLRVEILFGALHLPSKLYVSGDSQTIEATQIVQLIEEAERICGHDRTILLGDFN